MGIVDKIVFTIVVLLVISSLFGLLFSLYKGAVGDDCLERIAKEYCRGNNMDFDKMAYDFIEWKFYCREDSHAVVPKRFIFSKSELRSCKNAT